MNISPATKVYLLAGVTDMRLGYDGLFALARGDRCQGSCPVYHAV